jgi:polyferredoxin
MLLGIVQWKLSNHPLLVAERFQKGAGWFQVVLTAFYGGLVAWHMQDPSQSARWRHITWSLFSLLFFSQLVIGITVDERFLMSGHLHLPVPAMILAGPLYRMQLSFMTILFISTVLLTGPAWCSHLCYFGALDHLAAHSQTGRKTVHSFKKTASFSRKNRRFLPYSIFTLVIAAALLLRWLNAPSRVATLAGLAFGVGGLLIMGFVSRLHQKMRHCTQYCPVGTLVHWLRPFHPFTITLSDQCTSCQRCTAYCPMRHFVRKTLPEKNRDAPAPLVATASRPARIRPSTTVFFGLIPACQGNFIYL